MTDHAEILRRIDRGETMAYVAAALGTTRSAVAGVVRRARRKAAGLPATKRPRHQSVALEQAKFLGRQQRKASGEDRAPSVTISTLVGFQSDSRVGGAGCRFPLWRHEDRPDGRFCGKRVRGAGEPYCAKHHKLTHQKSATSFPQDGPMVVGGIRSGGPVGGLPSTAGV